ncbi:MAG: GNAT family N-acetyltransferase [Gemmatimonadota bacterium]
MPEASQPQTLEGAGGSGDGITIARSDVEILRCFPVMQQLRTHLVEDEFVGRVGRQAAGGYRLAFVQETGQVRAVAGFRYIDNLISGRILYVDDLVTDSNTRSRGHGGQLLRWLVGQAEAEGCSALELDSGVQRFDAHRFYLTHRMMISSHHFRLPL